MFLPPRLQGLLLFKVLTHGAAWIFDFSVYHMKVCVLCERLVMFHQNYYSKQESTHGTAGM